MNALEQKKAFVADLWFDRADALDRISGRIQAGTGDSGATTQLERFVREGYLSFHLPEAGRIAAAVEEAVDELWSRKPEDLAFSFIGKPRSMADSSARRHRRPPCRLHDPHSHSQAFLELYLHPAIFSWVRMLLGDKAIAVRSTFFEFAGREPLLRDALDAPTKPAGHVLTAWVALEAAGSENGTLVVYPGSHRLSDDPFEPGRIIPYPDEDDSQAQRFLLRAMRRTGVVEKVLTPKQGDVLLWHESLVHRSNPARKPGLSRKALSITFTLQEKNLSRDAAFRKLVRGRFYRKEERLFWKATQQTVRREDCLGLQNPLCGLRPRGLTLVEKLKNRLKGDADPGA